MSFSMRVEKPIKKFVTGRESSFKSIVYKTFTVSGFVGNIRLTAGFFARRKSAKMSDLSDKDVMIFNLQVKVRPKFWQKSLTLIVQNYIE